MLNSVCNMLLRSFSSMFIKDIGLELFQLRALWLTLLDVARPPGPHLQSIFVVPGFGFKASSLRGRCFITWVTPPAVPSSGIAQVWAHVSAEAGLDHDPVYVSHAAGMTSEGGVTAPSKWLRWGLSKL
jgi:hypothetical protein